MFGVLACVCCGLSFVVKRPVLGALCYSVSGVSCLFFVGCCLLFVVCCGISDVVGNLSFCGCYLCVVCCLLFVVVCCFLFVGRGFLFVVVR